MSHFVECRTEYRDPLALIAALVDFGFQESEIEVREEGAALYGFQSDVRYRENR
ncbi:MAG: hypothetical protein JSV78_10330 [Phycisphaerales bacterium]|nr:MAG: hypothetical protein JSV78_10330 [Phycisphaerales bacterium]